MNDQSRTSASPSPREEYERRLKARREEVVRRNRQESLAGNARVLAFLAILVAVYFIVRSGQVMIPPLLLAVAAFIAALAWHRRVVAGLERAVRAVGYYRRALDRLDGHWIGIGMDGQHYAAAEHPYSRDLDLFGRGSLYQLLCAARTRMGQNALAAWLCEAADAATIRARQQAVVELRERIDLREELAVLEGPIETEIKPKTLTAWIDMPPLMADNFRQPLAVVLSIASIVTLVGWIGFGTGNSWFLIAAILQALLLRTLRPAIGKLTADVETVLDELELLAEVLRMIEAQQFSSLSLTEIHRQLEAGGLPASRHVARLSRLVNTWETICENKFVAPIAFLLMLKIHLAYRIDRWRRAHRELVAVWLDACGRFEALVSLAGYAYEHPAHVFPEVAASEPEFDVAGLGHPLIAAVRRITNDVKLDPETRLLLVTGSNMSGKSTLLRAVGINSVLALAGAPVCAARMRISRLAVASAMRTVDSLQEGVSSFYAEIKRLRMICLMAAEPLPVLFLLDEILHGTNSHDRRIGAEAILDDLLKQGAIGLVTTHDLTLAEIATRRESHAHNVHFEDQMADGRISFDYRLRPGVVPKGNGLALMRMLGFEVEDSPAIPDE